MAFCIQQDFFQGAACSAQKVWLRAREDIGPDGTVPVTTYDMCTIGLEGHVTSRGLA
jgi:hypothetical protein